MANSLLYDICGFFLSLSLF